jgi:hypothetical protein
MRQIIDENSDLRWPLLHHRPFSGAVIYTYYGFSRQSPLSSRHGVNVAICKTKAGSRNNPGVFLLFMAGFLFLGSSYLKTLWL